MSPLPVDNVAKAWASVYNMDDILKRILKRVQDLDWWVLKVKDKGPNIVGAFGFQRWKDCYSSIVRNLGVRGGETLIRELQNAFQNKKWFMFSHFIHFCTNIKKHYISLVSDTTFF